jgi:transglutaminase-like putative cysteine protease
MRFAAVFFAALTAGRILAYDPAPEWAHIAAGDTDAAFLGSAAVAVRLDETLVKVETDGTFLTEHRVIIEILRNEGASSASHTVYYNAASDKVQEVNSWIMRNGVEVEQKGRREWLDIAANANGALIDETREIFVNLDSKAVKGDLVVFLTRVQSKEFLGDRIYDYTPFYVPRAAAKVEITLPAGWTVTQHSFGPMPKPLFAQDGAVSRWNLPATPFSAEESHSAEERSGLVISVRSPGAQLATFNDWPEVGRYVNQFQVSQCDTSPELSAKVKAVTAGCADDFARIRALGHYVQDLRYVAINRNLALGHGYRPRAASEVLHMGYGDCKDKATLLRALLREIGVKSSIVLVWVANGARIDEAVASPAWFNHAILAIELPTVPDEWRSATVTAGGRNFLIFDPTNRTTLVGDIGESIQDTRAFLCLDGGGEMITLPARDGESGFALHRRIRVQVNPSGAALCTGSIQASGQIAAAARSFTEASGTDLDLEKLVSYQMSEGFRQATITEKKFQDDPVSGVAQLDFSCSLPSYGQPIPGGRVVVKFDLFSHHQTPVFPEHERRNAIRLFPLVIHDEVTLSLDPGIELQDVPKPASIQSPYGKYSLQVVRQDNGLVVTRHYELMRTVVPVEEFARLKQFLNSVGKADRSAAILRSAAVQ